MDSSKLRSLVNKYFDLAKLLTALGIPFPPSGGSMRCPFHDDRHPSAKYYPPTEHYPGMIKCWACSRVYGSYDVLTVLMGVPDRELILHLPFPLEAQSSQYSQPSQPSPSLSDFETISQLFVCGKISLSECVRMAYALLWRRTCE